jgi:hypothetical protein
MAGKGAPISILGKDLIEVCGISNTRKYDSNVITFEQDTGTTYRSTP